MPERREILRTSGIGLTVGITGIGTVKANDSEASSNKSSNGRDRRSRGENNCDSCMEVLYETPEQRVTSLATEEGYYTNIVNKEDEFVSQKKYDEKVTDEEAKQLAQSHDGVGTMSAHEDIIESYSTWSGTIGSYSNLPQKEYGVAFTAGDELANYPQAALSSAACSVIGIANIALGAIAAAGCGLLGEALIDGDTEGEEATVGLWDESGGWFGEPYIRFGSASGLHDSHSDLTNTQSFPGMIAALPGT